MPIDEIQDLMRAAGLTMESQKLGRRFFEGKFTRPWAASGTHRRDSNPLIQFPMAHLASQCLAIFS
jgi:hypothetical protein